MSYLGFASLPGSTTVEMDYDVPREDDEPLSNTPEAPTPYEWMEDAVCAQVDPDLFFAPHQGSKQCHVAMKICLNCPVQEQCLEQALRVPACDDFGVWGATTPPQRELIRQMRRESQLDVTAFEAADVLGVLL